MSYKIKLKFISRNNQAVPNIFYETGIGNTVFSQGYSHQRTGESITFEVRGRVTHIKVAKEPNNNIQLVSLQPIEHNKLKRDQINEISIIVPVKIISLLLEKEKEGTYQRNSRRSSTHTIESGESLENIAKKHNLDVDDLAKRNGISDKNQIKAGQTIHLDKVKTDSPKAIETKVIYPSIIFHLVQKGDSLSSISKKYNVPTEGIKKINSLNSDKLILNQKIYITQAGSTKDRERKLANFIVLIALLDASKNTKRPITTISNQGTKQFYVSFSGQLAAGLGIGGNIQIGTATDQRGNVGIFITINGQVVAAGSSGASVDGAVTWTDAKDIKELEGWGYSTGAKLHVLAGGSASVGTSTTEDVDTGKEKKVTSKSTEFGVGVGANSNFGSGYTYVIPLIRSQD